MSSNKIDIILQPGYVPVFPDSGDVKNRGTLAGCMAVVIMLMTISFIATLAVELGV